MKKKELLENIYIKIFDTLRIYDFNLCKENYKLNRFKKTRIQEELAIIAKTEIDYYLYKYEEELHKIYEKENKNIFYYREKWIDNKNTTPKIIKKTNLINEYINLLEKLNIINQELYNQTEFYEDKYMIDYNHDLFNIFKNKLGYYTKLINKIKEEVNKP